MVRAARPRDGAVPLPERSRPARRSCLRGPAAALTRPAVETDEALVGRLLAEQQPQWARFPLARVEERRTDNDLYRLGDELVVRLPRRERPAQALVDECRWLPRLAPRLPLPVPVPVVVGRPGAAFPFAWAILHWLPGTDAAAAPVADERLLAADLGAFVSALQRLDPSGGPRPRESNVLRGAPLAVRDQATRAALARLPVAVDRDAARAVWDAALAAPVWERPPVWLHGDLDDRNLLVVDGGLAGVVDWGTIAVGDPACDAMAGWKLRSVAAREVFRDALEVDDPTWLRARGWALSQALVALASYAPDEQPRLVAAARRWLDSTLAS